MSALYLVAAREDRRRARSLARALRRAAAGVQRAAAVGRRRGVLLSVLLDRVAPPPDLDDGRAIDLVGWQRDRDDRRFIELV